LNGIFGNIEFKKAIRILLIIQIIFALLIILAFYFESFELKKEVRDNYAAIVGKVLKNNPGMEQDLVKALESKESSVDISYGGKVLSKYGFFSSLESHPFYKQLSDKRLLIIILLIIFSFAGAFLILYLGYNSFYKKVRILSEASEQVVEGNYVKSIPTSDEGDFGILEHRFNQMCERLNQGMASLKSEKNFLRETISDISHQLKTPLSTLMINNELMLNDSDMDLESRTAFLRRNGEQLKRMEWLIHSLLKMARLEAGSIVFRIEEEQLADIISDAINNLDEIADSKGIIVRINKPGSPVIFKGDSEWLIEALINIIKNAYEHCHQNGEVSIDIFETSLFYGLAIKDNGIGISAKDLPNIFKRFYKSDNSVKQNSVGIGLALSKSIIEGQGGSITAKSEVGKGSEFTITFLKDW
jgi:Signal transduction histidine kinase